MDEARSIAGGRYTLVEPLGEGGMAAVFRGYDHKLRVWRAVKLLNSEIAGKRKLRTRFESEAQVMAALEHPNIVRVYDIGVEDSQPYMVMELLEGGTPADWVDKHGPMPPRMAVDVVLQSCAGISAAHAAGIIHRDIKPQNVLIGPKGICKVTDFGIAHVDDAPEALTRTGSVMGTLGFMAPEQRSDAKSVDARADVYAVCAMLYTLLTDRVTMELSNAHEDDSILEGVIEPLRQVIIRGTKFRRDQRYPSIEALEAVLRDVQVGLPEDPPMPPLGNTGPPKVRPPPTTPTGWTAEPARPAALPTVAPDAGTADKAKLLAQIAQQPAQRSTTRPTPVRPDVPVGGARPARPAVPTPDGEALPSYAAVPEARPAPAPAPSSRAARLLSNDSVPDYVDPEEITRSKSNPGRRPYDIALHQGEEARPDVDPEPKGEGAEDLRPQIDDDDSWYTWLLKLIAKIMNNTIYPLRYVLGPTAMIVVSLCAVIGFGSTYVGNAADRARVASEDFTVACDAHAQKLGNALIDTGADAAKVNGALSAVQRADTPESKAAACMAFFDIVGSQTRGDPLMDQKLTGLGIRNDFNTSYQRMKNSRSEVDAATAEWAMACESKRAWVACGLGFAERPPTVGD